jgi:hypothetical protein
VTSNISPLGLADGLEVLSEGDTEAVAAAVAALNIEADVGSDEDLADLLSALEESAGRAEEEEVADLAVAAMAAAEGAGEEDAAQKLKEKEAAAEAVASGEYKRITDVLRACWPGVDIDGLVVEEVAAPAAAAVEVSDFGPQMGRVSAGPAVSLWTKC